VIRWSSIKIRSLFIFIFEIWNSNWRYFFLVNLFMGTSNSDNLLLVIRLGLICHIFLIRVRNIYFTWRWPSIKFLVHNNWVVVLVVLSLPVKSRHITITSTSKRITLWMGKLIKEIQTIQIYIILLRFIFETSTVFQLTAEVLRHQGASISFVTVVLVVSFHLALNR
jgi:hypothetical protein